MFLLKETLNNLSGNIKKTKQPVKGSIKQHTHWIRLLSCGGALASTEGIIRNSEAGE